MRHINFHGVEVHLPFNKKFLLTIGNGILCRLAENVELCHTVNVDRNNTKTKLKFMERTYVFNSDGNSGGARYDINAMLPGMLGGYRGVDPNVLALMNGNGGFGGQNGIWGVIYLAIVASIFGWNNGGFGGFGGFGGRGGMGQRNYMGYRDNSGGQQGQGMTGERRFPGYYPEGPYMGYRENDEMDERRRRDSRGQYM